MLYLFIIDLLFCYGSCNSFSVGMFEYYGLDKETLDCGEMKMIEANSIGMKSPSKFIEEVIQSSLDCALELDCIAPKGSSLENHRYDQSALSLQMALHQYGVQSEVDVRCCKVDNVPENEKDNSTSIQLMLRRQMFPKPYSKYVRACIEEDDEE